MLSLSLLFFKPCYSSFDYKSKLLLISSSSNEHHIKSIQIKEIEKIYIYNAKIDSPRVLQNTKKKSELRRRDWIRGSNRVEVMETKCRWSSFSRRRRRWRRRDRREETKLFHGDLVRSWRQGISFFFFFFSLFVHSYVVVY